MLNCSLEKTAKSFWDREKSELKFFKGLDCQNFLLAMTCNATSKELYQSFQGYKRR